MVLSATSLQASVALDSIEWQPDAYPMDFYSADSLGPWTPNFPEEKKGKTTVKIKDDDEASKGDCNDCRCGGR